MKSKREEFLVNLPNMKGKSVKEMSEIMGISVPTIYKHLGSLPDSQRALYIKPRKKAAANNEDCTMILTKKEDADKIRQLERKINDLKQESEDKDREISSLKESNGTLIKSLREVEIMLAIKHELVNNLTQNVKESKEEAELYLDRVKELEEDIDVLQEDYDYLLSTAEMLFCSEEQHYDGELIDALIEAVGRALGTFGDNSNYRRLLECFLSENKTSERKNRMLKALKNLKSMSLKSSRDLEKTLISIGFTVYKKSRAGHQKIRWMGDPRYQTSIPSTPSDRRDAANTVAEISNMIF